MDRWMDGLNMMAHFMFVKKIPIVLSGFVAVDQAWKMFLKYS